MKIEVWVLILRTLTWIKSLMKRILIFECAGHIHMVNGAMKGQTYNCMHYFANESQALEIGEIKNDNWTKSTFLDGTGRHKGVLGEFTGGPRISMGKAPDNKFGACREIKGFKRLAD